MTDLAVGLSLALVLEGGLWCLLAVAMKRAAARAALAHSDLVRAGGLAAMATGVVCVWLIRG